MDRDIDELALAALDGDQEAWTQLFNAVNPRLWALLRHKGANATDAEELAQATWVKFYERREQFNRMRKFMPYFFTIAIHLWIDHLKQEGNRPTVQLPEDVPGAPLLPSDELLDEEMLRQIEHCMETLTDEQREILQLRFWEGDAHKTIGGKIGHTESVVKGRCYRAVKTFADCIKLYLLPSHCDSPATTASPEA